VCALVLVLLLTFVASGASSDEGGASKALYSNDDNSGVQLITSHSQFQKEILLSDEVWIVQFFKSKDTNSQSFAVSYKEFLGKILKGVVRLAAVDVSDSESEFTKSMISKFKLKTFPTMYFFSGDKKTPSLYKGKIDIQAILQDVVNVVVKVVQTRANDLLGGTQKPPDASESDMKEVGNVVKLDEATFKSKVLNDTQNVWMVAFIAPWCGHCKALMPDWFVASEKLRGEGVMLGFVDATVETALAQQYGVKGFPTIKVFPGGPKTPSSAQEYQGGRTTVQIVQYALAEVDRSGVPKEVPELTTPDMLQDNCGGANKLCILVALPHILDSGAAGRNKYRETLNQVSRSFRGTPFELMWFEGGNEQMELEATLELTFGYPAVAAVSLDKQAFAVQRGAFNEKAISKFLNSIMSGRQATLPMQSSPVVKTTQPWDGLDAALVEEEPLDDFMEL
jgi:protein disulfide-isomerase A6